MSIYLAKPQSVEAFQMTKERRASNEEWPTWLNQAWNKSNWERGSIWPRDFPNSDGTDQLEYRTSDGDRYLVPWGSYLMLTDDGNITAMRQQEFEQRYDVSGC